MQRPFECLRPYPNRISSTKIFLLVIASYLMSCASPELSSLPRGEPILEFNKSCGENSFNGEIDARDGNVILWSGTKTERIYFLSREGDNCVLSFQHYHPDLRFLPTLYKTQDVLDAEIPNFSIDNQSLTPFGTYDFMAQFPDQYLSDCAERGLERRSCVEMLEEVSNSAVNIGFDARTEVGRARVDAQFVNGNVYYKGELKQFQL